MATLDKRELVKEISNSTCLHCRISALVDLHYAQHGELRGNVRLVGIADALWAMAQVSGELLAIHPDAEKREEFVCEMADDVRATIADVLKDGPHKHSADIAWPQ